MLLRLLSAVGLLPILCSTAACSGPDLVNAFVPSDGYRVERDIAYGEAARQRLDLYIPEGVSSPVPTVVFFYGGNWQSGSKTDYLFAGEAFASHGFLTVIPDYRLYPEVRFPGFVQDGAKAVGWVSRELAQAAKVTPGPIYLVGHSAGAYIAAMLTLDARWLAEAEVDVCATVAASAGLAGPYDFLPLEDETLKIIFGPSEDRPRTQPINHVDGSAPPLLLVTGRDDTTVRPANASRLAARITEDGGIADTRFYDGIGHIKLVAALASPLRSLAPVLEDVTSFFRRYPRPGTSAGCGNTARIADR